MTDRVPGSEVQAESGEPSSEGVAARVVPSIPEERVRVLLQIAEAYQGLFVQNLQNRRDRGAGEARDYLASRGFSEQDVLRFGIGYVPNARDTILRFAQKQGFAPEDLVDLSLAKRSDYKVKEVLRKHLGREPKPSELTEDAVSHFLREVAPNLWECYNEYPGWEVEGGEKSSWLRGNSLTLPVPLPDSNGELRVGAWVHRSLRNDLVNPDQNRYKTPRKSHVLFNRSEVLVVSCDQAKREERGPYDVILEGQLDQLTLEMALGQMEPGDRPSLFSLLGAQGRQSIPVYREMDREAARRSAGRLAHFEGRTVMLLYDMDAAGVTGTMHDAIALMHLGCNVRVARVRDGWLGNPRRTPKDTNALYQSAGPGGMHLMLERGMDRDIFAFLREELANRMDVDGKMHTMDRRFSALDHFVPFFPFLSPEEQRERAQEVGTFLDLPAEVVLAQVEAMRQARRSVEVKSVLHSGVWRALPARKGP